MNMKKAIKRIVALGTGAALMGATVLGAMAADLSNFPEPFVEDGQFNSMIVIGDAAKTPDVIGAVDIATTLQYEMREPAAVGGSEATTVTVSGDSMELSLSNDKLAKGDFLGSVINVLEEDDLEALSEETFVDEDYTQEITLADDTGKIDWFSEGGEKYEDEPGFYMYFEEDKPIYTYVLDFTTPETSDIADDGSLEDFEDETLIFMGKSYNLVNSDVDGDTVSLEFMGGDSRDVMEEYTTKTYTVGGKEYEVEATYIGTDAAKFRINGEFTDALEKGETEMLSDGTEIGIREILENDGSEENGADLVEFYMGANKLVLKDNDFTDEAAGGQYLEVGGETYNNVVVEIVATAANDEFDLDTIEVEVTADDEYYLAEGDKLSDFIDGKEEDYLFGNIDFTFQGMTEPQMQEVKLEASIDDEYTLTVDVLGGGEYDLPLWYATGGADARPGDADDVLWLHENSSLDVADAWIAMDDYFLMTTGDADPEDREAQFFQLDAFDDSDGTLTISDLSGGDVTVRLEETATGSEEWTGTDRILGETRDFVFNESNERLAVDMFGSGDGAFGLVSGAYMHLDPEGRFSPALEQEPFGNNTMNVSVTVPSDLQDGATDDLNFNFSLEASGDEVAMGDLYSGNAGFSDVVAVDDDDYQIAYTEYGIMWRKDVDSDQEQLDLHIPYTQMLPQVFATSGDIRTQTVEGGDGAAYEIAPVAAGIAELDTEVGSSWRNNNVIVVGGPCVNTVAAELLDNPAECTEGFEEGRATIKLFEQSGDNVAMLVAGYDGEDTRRAARVIHNYRDHGNFEGSEVEVSGTSMSDISVTSVQ